MTRTMFDSVDAAHLPVGGDLYLAYVDGAYRNVEQVRARFPGTPVVTVTVLGGDADVADCENGDLTPASSVAWVRRQRAVGKDPTLYTPFADWSTCRAAFAAAGESEPHWFIAHYANKPGMSLPAGFTPSIPAGALACQYGGDLPGNYDVSLVADFWPGIDPAPTPNQSEEDDSMKPVAGTPSWCQRHTDGPFKGQFPRLKATLDGEDAIVTSIADGPFAPMWSAGDHGSYVDFATAPQFGSLWCRRFKGAGEPFGFSEVAGAFFLVADHGTFDVAAKPAPAAAAPA